MVVKTERINSVTTFPYVKRISVRDLFGRYTYDLHLRSEEGTEAARLLILYGDNGTGKTTLIEMLFHLLNPARTGGHRGFIAHRIFRYFEVELGNGTLIVAERTKRKLVGPFRMTIRPAHGTPRTIEWLTGPGGGVTGAKQGDDQEQEFINYLAGLNVGLYLLSDDRKISATRHYEGFDEMPPDYVALERDESYALSRVSRTYRTTDSPEDDSTDAALELTIWRASNWATQQVLKATSKGEEDANAIFTKIVQGIVSHQKGEENRSAFDSKKILIQSLNELSERSVTFWHYGILAPTNVDALVSAIQAAAPHALPAIGDVVKPYIDGLTARMNALQKVNDSIDTFITNVNSFLHDKNVTFHMGTGMTISTPDAQSLPLAALSSGERQLVLLFTNLFVATRQDSLFIVDEPELSLNVKWQRRLIQQLLQVTAGSRVQFVFATHSIELLTRYKDYVAQLEQRTKKTSV